MARILVIEDERDLQKVLGYNLRQAGHEVVAALRGKEGLQLGADDYMVKPFSVRELLLRIDETVRGVGYRFTDNPGGANL